MLSSAFKHSRGSFTTTLRNLAKADLPPTPPSFAEVVARVEVVEGVRFAALFERLPRRAPSTGSGQAPEDGDVTAIRGCVGAGRRGEETREAQRRRGAERRSSRCCKASPPRPATRPCAPKSSRCSRTSRRRAGGCATPPTASGPASATPPPSPPAWMTRTPPSCAASWSWCNRILSIIRGDGGRRPPTNSLSGGRPSPSPCRCA